MWEGTGGFPGLGGIRLFGAAVSPPSQSPRLGPPVSVPCRGTPLTGTASIAALRKARRQEQLVSKRLLREDEQDGAEVLLQPLPEDEVRA